jgi:hypothetical protein
MEGSIHEKNSGAEMVELGVGGPEWPNSGTSMSYSKFGEGLKRDHDEGSLESGRNGQDAVFHASEWGFSAQQLLPASAAPQWTVRPYIHRGFHHRPPLYF